MKEEYIGGIRKETYDLLFKDENIQNSEVIDTTDNDKILDTIAFFTKFDNNLLDKYFLKRMAKKFKIDISKISYDKEKNIYNYNLEDMQMAFEKLSDRIQDKKIKRELLSNDRIKKCHEKTKSLIGGFANPATILTGTYERRGKRCLHSIIELQREDDIYIADYTLNLIMKKESYSKLVNFKQIEDIKDIDALEDMKDGSREFLKDIDFITKPYLTFRKELKRDLEKNKSMLEEVENQELDDRIEEIKKQREEGER